MRQESDSRISDEISYTNKEKQTIAGQGLTNENNICQTPLKITNNS